MQFSQVKHQIQLLKDPSFGHIRIGGGYSFLHYYLPDLLVNQQTDRPNLTFSLRTLTSHQVYELIEQYKLDFGFVTTVKPSHHIEQIDLPIFSTIKVIAPPSFPAKDTLTFKELETLPIILFDEQSSFTQTILQKLPVQVNVKVVVDHIDSAIRLVEKGVGISIIPLRPDNEECRFKCLELEEDIFPSTSISLIYRKNRYLPPSFVQFIDKLTTFWKRKN
ncbi:LysR family transcriptional regulator substrate-binding protein [Bacillus salitolerans]|uniref:LysR family transcriptional regulator substrate-binding protein n=1 Tax=Bacillus salitolerans TaxID=1437434 RepID=A0ABW4LU34_9BACI